MIGLDLRLCMVQLDPGGYLIGIRGPVTQGCVDLGSSQGRLLDNHPNRIRICPRQVLDPHGDLPHIRPPDQPGPPTGWAIAEGDQRMFVPPYTLIGIAAQALRQRLARGSSPHPQPLRQAPFVVLWLKNLCVAGGGHHRGIRPGCYVVGSFGDVVGSSLVLQRTSPVMWPPAPNWQGLFTVAVTLALVGRAQWGSVDWPRSTRPGLGQSPMAGPRRRIPKTIPSRSTRTWLVRVLLLCSKRKMPDRLPERRFAKALSRGSRDIAGPVRARGLTKTGVEHERSSVWDLG